MSDFETSNDVVATLEVPTSPTSGPRIFAGLQRHETSAALPKLENGDLAIADESDYQFGTATPVLADALDWVIPIGDREPRREKARKELRLAGYYEPHALQNLYATRYAGILLTILLFGTLLVVAAASAEWIAMIGLCVGVILAWAVPALVVQAQGSARKREIERSIPDMLDLLNMCISQGMTPQAALARVGRDMRQAAPALAQELQIVAEQSKVGSFEQALDNFSERLDSDDVRSFTSLLTQTEQMGTSVAESLAEYSDNIRVHMKQRADEKANTAAFLLLFPTMLLLIAVFLFLLGPAIVELSDFFAAGGVDALDNSQAAERAVGR